MKFGMWSHFVSSLYSIKNFKNLEISEIEKQNKKNNKKNKQGNFQVKVTWEKNDTTFVNFILLVNVLLSEQCQQHSIFLRVILFLISLKTIPIFIAKQ